MASAAVAHGNSLVQHFREAATLYANKERLRYASNIKSKAARRAAQVAAAPAVSSRRGAPPHSIRANRRRPPLDEGRYVPPQMSVILELQEKNFVAMSSSSSLPTLMAARVFPSRCKTKLTTEEQASSRAAKNASRGAELDLLLFDRVFQQDNIMAKTTAWDKTMTPTMDAKLLAEVVSFRSNRSLLLDQLLVKEVGAVHAAEEGGARGSGGSGGGAGEGGGANPPADASAELHPQQSDLPLASLVFGGDGGTEEAMDLDDVQHQQPVGAGGLGVFSMQADPVGASAPIDIYGHGDAKRRRKIGEWHQPAELPGGDGEALMQAAALRDEDAEMVPAAVPQPPGDDDVMMVEATDDQQPGNRAGVGGQHGELMLPAAVPQPPGDDVTMVEAADEQQQQQQASTRPLRLKLFYVKRTFAPRSPLTLYGNLKSHCLQIKAAMDAAKAKQLEYEYTDFKVHVVDDSRDLAVPREERRW